jgi:hypothetical protein
MQCWLGVELKWWKLVEVGAKSVVGVGKSVVELQRACFIRRKDLESLSLGDPVPPQRYSLFASVLLSNRKAFRKSMYGKSECHADETDPDVTDG